MILTNLKVLELNDKYHLIEGLCERYLQNPEGVGFDLRVGEVYQLKGEGFLGVNDRRTSEEEKIGDIITDGTKKISMYPGTYLLVKTMEKIRSPNEKIDIGNGQEVYLMPLIHPRNTLQRCGVSLISTKTDVGSHGELTVGLANIGNYYFKFELGARMFNVVFEEVYGDIKRVSSGLEKKI